jgi:tRNA-specific 2-thiouridylase
MKALVGMSGGVDSSMAAFLLKAEGYEVEGISLLLFETKGKERPNACCSLQSVGDAGETASRIGIPHFIIDARTEFMEHVMEPFVESYTKGLTPNPCILCNRHIKFPILLREAESRGAEFISTGHYARVEHGGSNHLLKKGIDPDKDQSYVLYALRAEELGRLLLPLGPWKKKDVRERARELSLPVFKRPESQEICFVEDKDYAGFISSVEPDAVRPGPIIDERGIAIGEHNGIFGHTVGQRKGLGISSPHPLYVTKIDVRKNAIHIGSREAAMAREFTVSDLNWLLKTEREFRADVRVRSTMQPKPASVVLESVDRARVTFDNPQFAPAPGQSAVFYDNDTVIGGGVIEPEEEAGQ